MGTGVVSVVTVDDFPTILLEVPGATTVVVVRGTTTVPDVVEV